MKYILVISLICLTLSIFATPVRVELATRVASNWTAQFAPGNNLNRAIEQVIPIQDSDTVQLYLFKYADGFVLTSADDSAKPIIAYGYNTNVDDAYFNPAFKDYLNCMQTEMKQITNQRLDNRVTSEEWRLAYSGDFSRNETRSMEPLLTTRWDQGWPYNMYCPADAAGPNGRVYAGCVATAMAQVMKYWNWPNTGVGSHTYYASGYGSQTANFGQTTYDWSQMPNSVGSPNEEVGKLLYHLGVSVNMGYSPSGSGAQSYNAVTALRQNFRYNNGIQLLDKDENYSTWDQMLKNELDNARPVYYHGFGDDGGHAFVCDGYQGTDYFHFNWGWSGSYNGYFYTDNLNPGLEFNSGQGAMFNVYPLNYNISMVHLALESMNCQAGENIPVSITSYPIIPQWNINSASFIMEYDYENVLYTGFETDETMLSNATVNASILQPGRIEFTINSPTVLSGAGTLLRLKFKPILPGGYAFNLTDFSFNTTSVTLITQATITVTAEVAEPQNSVIDLLNALHVIYNQVATIPITTTYVLPSWNVTTVDFILSFPQDKLSWEGYDTTGCMSENAVINVNTNTPGSVSINMSFPDVLIGSGNLIQLRFRALSNLPIVTLAKIMPLDFYYGSIAVQNLQPGYITINPSTANEDENIAQVSQMSLSPNPFHANAAINIELSKQNQHAEVKIYNVKGQLIKSIFGGTIKSYKTQLNWDGTDESGQIVQTGIYFIKADTNTYHKTIKVFKQ